MTQVTRMHDRTHAVHALMSGTCLKTTNMLRSAMLLCLVLATHVAMAQNPLVFQPGSGSNDGTDEGGLNGGKDTWVYDGDPSMNYGAHAWCYSMPQTTCNNTNVRGFLKFDVSTLPATVDSVLLALDFVDQTDYCYSNCQASFSFNYVDAAWDEMTMTWNSQPSPSDPFAGPFSIAFPEVGGERHYDVTDAYLAWRTGSRANHGFTIVPLDGSCNNAAIFFGFYSSDDTTAAHEPARLLVYTNTIGIPEPGIWSTLRITPNPAADVAVIDVPAAIGRYRADLLDGTGRIILQQGHLADQRMTLALDGLDAGVYLVRLTTEHFGTAVRRLVKQ